MSRSWRLATPAYVQMGRRRAGRIVWGEAEPSLVAMVYDPPDCHVQIAGDSLWVLASPHGETAFADLAEAIAFVLKRTKPWSGVTYVTRRGVSVRVEATAVVRLLNGGEVGDELVMTAFHAKPLPVLSRAPRRKMAGEGSYVVWAPEESEDE